jgi:hypothetical protein
MNKVILIHIKIICLFFLVVFFSGCDNQSEPPQAPSAITQKIPVNTPAQSVPSKPPAQPPPVQKQLSSATQPAPTTKTETPSKAIQPMPAAEKSHPEQEKKTASTQPAPAAAQAIAKQAAVSAEKPQVEAPSDPSQDRKPGIATDTPAPETKMNETSATDGNVEKVSDTEAPELDLAKLAADTAGGYRPAGRVDPFQPLFEEKPIVPEDTADAEKQKKKRRMPLTPLERVDLSQLKLVGIFQAPSGNKALVEEASGKGYIIK